MRKLGLRGRAAAGGRSRGPRRRPVPAQAAGPRQPGVRAARAGPAVGSGLHLRGHPGGRLYRVGHRRVFPADRRRTPRPTARPGPGRADDGGHLPGRPGRQRAGLIHHSDAGSESLSIRYGAELAAAGIGPVGRQRRGLLRQRAGRVGHRPVQDRGHRPPRTVGNPRPGRGRHQRMGEACTTPRRPDHRHRIRPPQQREHRKQNMRPTALTAPRPPRPQHHRAAVITQRSRPGPAPRPQRTATTRTHQLTVGEPFLDSGSVGPYREHSASARDTALPDALGQETPGGPFVCPHRHGAAAYQQHTQPSTHQDPSAPTMPGNRPPRRIPQRRSTVRDGSSDRAPSGHAHGSGGRL